MGSARTSTYDPIKKRWRQADDSMPGADGGGGSPWPLFAKKLAERLNFPVAVLSVGCGGTSGTDWLPQMAPTFTGQETEPSVSANGCTSSDPRYSKNLFARIRDTFNFLGPGGARAVFWHQGETDAVAGLSKNDYEFRLAFLLAQFNTETHTTWNFVVARASYFPGNDVGDIGCSTTEQVNQFRNNMNQIRAAPVFTSMQMDWLYARRSGLRL